MTTVAAVRDDIAAILNAKTIRAIGWMPDAIPAPCVVVSRREMDPRMVFSEAKAAYQFLLRVYVPRTSERAGQDQLDEWCEPTGSTSIMAALQTGSNWTQTVDYAVVTSIGEVFETARADEVFLAVDIEVEVVW